MTPEKPTTSTPPSPNNITLDAHWPRISPPISEPHRPTMSPPTSPAPPSSPTPQYAVCQHALTSSPTHSPTLIHTAPDFPSAHTSLLTHASAAINAHPSWGATSARTFSNFFEILGPDALPRLRYSIATQPDPGAQYGMLVKFADAQTFVVGGFRSLGEASSAVKGAARGYVQGKEGCKVIERSVEVLGEKGEGVVRYSVVEGGWRGDEFVVDGEEGEVEGKRRNLRLEGKSEAATIADDKHAAAKHSASGSEKHLTPAPERNTPAAEKLTTPIPNNPSTPASSKNNTSFLKTLATPISSPPFIVATALDLWCTCRTPDDGSLMIECENKDCAVQWYHGRCLGITRAPVGKWYCASCAPAKRKAVEEKGKGGRKKRKTG